METLTTTAAGPLRPGDVSAVDNEFYWDQLDEKDRRYLTGPRRWPDPCAWCGGRRCHSAMCDELHEHWAVRLKFGKYKGRKIQDLPSDYLLWLLKVRAVRDQDARKDICRFLGIDEDQYRDEWQ
jgi:hypothetical protein